MWQLTPVSLPGESPWTEESGRLQSMGLQRVGHDLAAPPSTVCVQKVAGEREVLLNRCGECWVKHELLLWDFSEPLKCSLCRKALNGAREALLPFHLFLAL